jgi:hypothetical protein
MINNSCVLRKTLNTVISPVASYRHKTWSLYSEGTTYIEGAWEQHISRVPGNIILSQER